ncbi:DUF3570 domain-containing protein [Chryseobacterium salivictor]|uniref:DUF3570 domain-containing protein n=1 Tax=Chryseobacterium salivictor TaxID=2547600 RepID=UPI001FE89F81|nr:DUF3570 domain-containing protein [Chryseobacterium salivictor]
MQQTGFLSLPFHRVYFTDGSVHQENLPDKRFKIPLGMRANCFLGDQIILRTSYRYYTDDWGLKSNTVSIETPVKISPFASVSPFYRFYSQTGTPKSPGSFIPLQKKVYALLPFCFRYK